MSASWSLRRDQTEPGLLTFRRKTGNVLTASASRPIASINMMMVLAVAARPPEPPRAYREGIHRHLGPRPRSNAPSQSLPRTEQDSIIAVGLESGRPGECNLLRPDRSSPPSAYLVHSNLLDARVLKNDLIELACSICRTTSPTSIKFWGIQPSYAFVAELPDQTASPSCCSKSSASAEGTGIDPW